MIKSLFVSKTTYAVLTGETRFSSPKTNRRRVRQIHHHRSDGIVFETNDTLGLVHLDTHPKLVHMKSTSSHRLSLREKVGGWWG